jgi:N-methylhydantoinase B
MFSFFGGGLGGNPQSDGLNHANNPISTATIPPAEVLEASYPVMFTQWALRPDSAGAGAHRGGVGAIYEIEILDARGAEVSLLGERGRHAPFGVAGGGPGALNAFCWDAAEGRATPADGLEGHRRAADSGPTADAAIAGRRRLGRGARA